MGEGGGAGVAGIDGGAGVAVTVGGGTGTEDDELDGLGSGGDLGPGPLGDGFRT
jgi:hypothetical protein